MSDRSQRPFLGTELFGSFWLGTLTAAAFSYVTFGDRILSPQGGGFECIVLGTLAAAMLALVGRRRMVEAVVLIPAYAWLRLAFTPNGNWGLAISALLLAAGTFLVALIFEQLAQHGVRFGKFLVTGPLLGGVCLAVAPLSQFDVLSAYDSFDPLMLQLFIGIVIGDGAALGVELADLLFRVRRQVATASPTVDEKPCPR